MSWTRSARAVLAFSLLVLLHYTIRPFLGWRTPVDFLVIAVLLSAVRVRPGAAALIGFCTGSSPTRSRQVRSEPARSR